MNYTEICCEIKRFMHGKSLKIREKSARKGVAFAAKKATLGSARK
jgi:hypothetical protein